MPATSEVVLVAFRGGFVANAAVVSRLLELEARGARFELKSDGGFRVTSGLGADGGRYRLPAPAQGRGAARPRVSG